jgi:hypothetical protein
MGIRSTKRISRAEAIERIKGINRLAETKDYRQIERSSHEDHDEEDIVKFVDSYKHLCIDKWTNRMLGDKMDEPFFRYSMFENYLVYDEVPEEL